MEFAEVLRRRRMVRDFSSRPVPAEMLDRVLAAALRAPSAGFAQGSELVVLEGPQTALYWEATTTPEWRASNRSHAGARRAPVVVVPLFDPSAYLRRYSEPDKSPSGLGEAEESWPVPYWMVDCAFGVMAMLLAAVDEGLGALFMGVFRGEEALLRALGVPAPLRPLGAVVLGWPEQAPPSASALRGRRPASEVVHRGGYRNPE